MKKYRKSYSPRKNRGYSNDINEEPEKDIDYTKYFEKVLPKEKSTDRYSRHKKYKYDSESQDKKWTKFPQKGNNYQVFAYQDTDQHRGVFRTKKTVYTLSTSENEFRKSCEYPMLAFKDNNIERSGSDTVYLPVIVLNKKSHQSRDETIPKQTFTSAPLGNVQVFAANVNDQQNIFQRLGEVSNKKSEITTYHDKVYSKNALDAVHTTAGHKNANPILGSTGIHGEFNPKQYLENLSNAVETSQKDSFNMNNNKFIYDVHIKEPKIKTRKLKKEPDDVNNLTKYKNIEMPIHDEYPVTKNYIKINNNDPEHWNNNRSKQEKNYKEKRNPTTIGNHSGIQEMNKTISQRIANNGAVQGKQSVIKRNYTQLSDENNFAQEYGSQNKSLKERSKRGSVDVVNSSQKSKEISMKDLPEMKTLHTINKESIKKQKETIKKIPSVHLLRELIAEKRTGAEYKMEDAILQEVGDTRKSAATVRKSYDLQRTSQTNLLREDHEIQKSRTASLKQMPLQKKSTLTFQDRQLDQGNFTHRSSQISIKTAENTAVKVRNKNTPKITDQVSREELSIDYDQQEKSKGNISTQRSKDIVRKTLSKISTKDSFNRGTIQRFDTQREQSFLKQHSARQTMGEITKDKKGDPKISTGVTYDELPYKEYKLEDLGSQEESIYVNNKNILSVNDDLIKKSKKSDPKSPLLKKSKSKLSLKKITSSLINLGKKKSSSKELRGSKETYISTGTRRTLSKPKPTIRPQESMDSLQSQILDTYDYEPQKEKLTSKSRISMRAEESKPRSLSTKLNHSKSTSILPSTKKSILKMFSGWKSKQVNDKIEDAKTKSQTEIRDSRTEKSKKGRWKWFKSKSDIREDSVPTLTSEYEEPPLPTYIEDKRREIETEVIGDQSESYKEKEEEKEELLKEKYEPCKCFAEYIKIGRECANFFLGINLHKQIMRIIDLF